VSPLRAGTPRLAALALVLGALSGMSAGKGAPWAPERVEPGAAGPGGNRTVRSEEVSVESETIFHIRSRSDLMLPVQQAYAAALEKGGRFRVRFAPGDYGRFALSLRDVEGAGALDLLLEGEGDDPAVIEGLSLALEGRTVTLRNLILRRAEAPVAVLTVGAVESFVAERFAILDSLRFEPQIHEPLVSISAAGPRGTTATATLRDCWFVGNRVQGGSPLLATPRTGRSHLASLRLDGVVFARNEAAYGIEPWFTRSLTVERTLVIEDRLAHGWLRLVSPLVRVELAGSLLSSTTPLVRLVSGPDVALGDFPPVVARKCELRQGSVGEPEGIAAEACTRGEAWPRPGERSPLTEGARRAAVVDPRALVAALGL